MHSVTAANCVGIYSFSTANPQFLSGTVKSINSQLQRDINTLLITYFWVKIRD